MRMSLIVFFQAEDGIRDIGVTGVQTCALPIFGAELLLARDVVGLEIHGPKRVLRLDDGSSIGAHAVVLATGVSYRSLGVPGCDELTGRSEERRVGKECRSRWSPYH